MIIQSMSDIAITEAIGHRLHDLRLRRNMSFLELSADTGISRQTLHTLLHRGKGTLATVVAVMRALGDLESMALMLAEVPPSPIQLLRVQGVQRKRATGGGKKARQNLKPTASPKNLDW